MTLLKKRIATKNSAIHLSYQKIDIVFIGLSFFLSKYIELLSYDRLKKTEIIVRISQIPIKFT